MRQVLKNNYACFRLPQDGIDTIVAKLFVSGKAQFKCSLDLWRGVARESDLIFLNIKSGIFEDNLIIFAEIAIDVIAVVCVVDHFFGESAIKSIFDVSERLGMPMGRWWPSKALQIGECMVNSLPPGFRYCSILFIAKVFSVAVVMAVLLANL